MCEGLGDDGGCRIDLSGGIDSAVHDTRKKLKRRIKSFTAPVMVNGRHIGARTLLELVVYR